MSFIIKSQLFSYLSFFGDVEYDDDEASVDTGIGAGSTDNSMSSILKPFISLMADRMSPIASRHYSHKI